MPLVDFDLTAEHLENIEWRSALVDCKAPDCVTYSRALFQRSNADGLEEAAKAGFRFLAGVMSPMLTPDKPNPFSPVLVLATGRSAIPEDLSEKEVELLPWLAENASDAEIEARACDYLWHLRRRHEFGRQAVAAYFASAKRFEETGNWHHASTRVARAVGIAARLGKNGEPFQRALANLETLAARTDEGLPDTLTLSHMKTLAAYGVDDPARWATLAASKAKRCEELQNRHFARFFWRLASKWSAQSKDPVGEREALLRIAETYLAEADDALKPENARSVLRGIHFLEASIEAFRRVGGSKVRVGEIRHRIDELRPQMVGELKHLSVPVDIGELVASAREHVAGKPFLNALEALGLGMHPVGKARAREHVISLSKEFPLQALISTTVMDASGRPVARRAGLMSEGEAAEQALADEMFKHAAFEHTVTASGFIEPARQQIVVEHPCLPHELEPLVAENPFVPPDRVNLFILGLHAGLHGDFFTSTHILVLQIENSLRYVLASRGVPITSSQDGIEEVLGLDSILALPQTTEIFGEDAVFDLRALLTERFGSNLRNRIAHGLVSDHEFFVPEGSYLWWLVLHLCCVPLVARRKLEATPPVPGEVTPTPEAPQPAPPAPKATNT